MMTERERERERERETERDRNDRDEEETETETETETEKETQTETETETETGTSLHAGRGCGVEPLKMSSTLHDGAMRLSHVIRWRPQRVEQGLTAPFDHRVVERSGSQRELSTESSRIRAERGELLMDVSTLSVKLLRQA